MRPQVAESLARSQRDFLELVWPQISRCCGGGDIIPVESVSDSGFASTLDLSAGIDAWQTLEDANAGTVLRGIASRVQWGDRVWDTFTVRRTVASGRPTEYAKRLAALNEDRGYLYPHLTVQAYINDGVLLSVGVARTRQVIEAVRSDKHRPNPQDGSTFFYVAFDDVLDIKRWPRARS
jgi:hypothetical protein